MTTFRRSVELPVSADEAFDWHARPGALPRLTPPWEPITATPPTDGIRDGSEVQLKMHAFPWGTWLARHSGFESGRKFVDDQIRGPFARFHHEHRFEPRGPQACTLHDELDYQLPLEPLSRWVAGAFVRGKLSRMFDYRHRVTAGDLARHRQYQHLPRLRVLISGGTGLVGTALSAFLATGGHTVVHLSRSARPGLFPTLVWQPDKGELAAHELEGFDAVVHLAGESIASGRWSPAIKQRIRNSRVQGTQLLCERLATLAKPPRVVISASATGVYGDRGNEVLTEQSPPGQGFLVDVATAWEAATSALQGRCRVVCPRFGIVLSAQGGALRSMLPPFVWGVGGRVGSGRQYWSWIALDDLLYGLQECLFREEIAGPVNFVAPTAIDNRQFTQELASAVNRPAWFPVPAVALRLLLGEMANELLLASTRVQPTVLQNVGYEFAYPTLPAALAHVLGTPQR